MRDGDKAAPANDVRLPITDCDDADFVTMLSQLGANSQSQRGTTRNSFGWLTLFESHCDTTQFSSCLTGGQVKRETFAATVR